MNYEAKVLGIKYLDFVTDAGEVVKGWQVFVSVQTDEAAWSRGVEVVKCWIASNSKKADLAAALIPGDVVSLEFNRRGKPVISEVA